MKIFAILILCFSTLASAKNFQTEKWTTTKGSQVVFYQTMEVPMLDISLAFAAGSAFDGQNFGLGTLVNGLLNQGNAGLDANAIAEMLEDTGAQYDANTTRDMAVLNLRTLTKSEDMRKAIAVFQKIITAPDFPAAAFIREKNQQLLAIKQSLESPDDVANQAFFKNLYQEHPYAHPVNGLKETVELLDNEQVKKFYKKYYVGKNSVLVMVGAIDSAQAHQIAEQLTKDLPQGERALAIPPATPLAQSGNQSIPFPSSQTIIRLGQLGITHHSPDYFALMVGNYILGGNTLTSILGLEIREKQGLTYGINSQFIPMTGTGPFLISLSTKNKTAAHALDVSRKLLDAWVQKGPDSAQLTAARQYLTGNFALSLSSNRNIANTMLKMAFYALPDDWLDNYISRINQVDEASIKKAFATHIQPAVMLSVSVGKP